MRVCKPVIIKRRNNSSLKFFVDYRKINQYTTQKPFPISNMKKYKRALEKKNGLVLLILNQDINRLIVKNRITIRLLLLLKMDFLNRKKCILI